MRSQRRRLGSGPTRRARQQLSGMCAPWHRCKRPMCTISNNKLARDRRHESAPCRQGPALAPACARRRAGNATSSTHLHRCRHGRRRTRHAPSVPGGVDASTATAVRAHTKSSSDTTSKSSTTTKCIAVVQTGAAVFLRAAQPKATASRQLTLLSGSQAARFCAHKGQGCHVTMTDQSMLHWCASTIVSSVPVAGAGPGRPAAAATRHDDGCAVEACATALAAARWMET